MFMKHIETYLKTIDPIVTIQKLINIKTVVF